MPEPESRVTARLSVSVEDISRAYYESAGYTNWITQLQLNPLQLIVADDATGKYHRVPISLKGDEFEFGAPVEVAVEFLDVKTDKGAKAAASALTFTTASATRAEVVTGSPGGEPPADPPETPDTPQPPAPRAAVGLSAADAIRQVAAASTKTPASQSASGSNPSEASTVDKAKMREALGLAPDASDDEFTAALLAAAGAGAAPPAAPAQAGAGDAETVSLPPLVPGRNADAQAVLVDPSQLLELRRMALKGQEAFDTMRKGERDRLLNEAVKLGKFPPSRLKHYQQLWESDPEGTRQTVETLSANLIPTMAAGYASGDDNATEGDAAYRALYGDGGA